MTGGWSRKFDRCVKCGQTNSSYRGKGMCTTCYDETRRRAKGQIDKKQVCEHKLVDGIELVYCRHCNIWKPITEFTKGLRRRDGLKSFCRDCENEYYRGRAEDRYRERMLNKLREQNGCYLCGRFYTEPSTYDFHHTIREKGDLRMYWLLRKANEGWEEEANKCILICANCHRLKHAGEDRNPVYYEQDKYGLSRKNDVERRKRRREERKQEILKHQSGCFICGLQHVCLNLYDFHHNEGIKEKNLSKMLAYANDKWRKEAEKCILVCANCHRLIHSMGIEKAKKEAERVRSVPCTLRF